MSWRRASAGVALMMIACGGPEPQAPRLVTDEVLEGLTEGQMLLMDVDPDGSPVVIRQRLVAERLLIELPDGRKARLAEELRAIGALSDEAFPIQINAPRRPPVVLPPSAQCAQVCTVTPSGFIACTRTCLCPNRSQWPGDWCGRGSLPMLGGYRLLWTDDYPAEGDPTPPVEPPPQEPPAIGGEAPPPPPPHPGGAGGSGSGGGAEPPSSPSDPPPGREQGAGSGSGGGSSGGSSSGGGSSGGGSSGGGSGFSGGGGSWGGGD